MICKAEKSHIPLLKAMFSEFYASEAVHENIPESYHEAALFELFSERSLQRCYILGQEEGYALLSLKFSHEAGGMELWLEELYLRPASRGKGLGKEFFAFLLESAQKEGISRIRLEVEPENERAKKLYRSLGFRPLPYGQLIWTPEVL